MIEYRDSLQGIEPKHLQGFFVSWPNPPKPQTHLRILQGSSHVVLAMEREQVVGYINAISDGILSAYIPLLEVLPSHQGQSIGSGLLRRMLKRLEGFYMVDLLCDPELQTFYEHLGMQRTPGMMLRNYERQSGH